jgi:hypothetical protein
MERHDRLHVLDRARSLREKVLQAEGVRDLRRIIRCHAMRDILRRPSAAMPIAAHV